LAYFAVPLIHNPLSPPSTHAPPFFEAWINEWSSDGSQGKAWPKHRHTHAHIHTDRHMQTHGAGVTTSRYCNTPIYTADAWWERAPGWPRDHVLLMLLLLPTALWHDNRSSLDLYDLCYRGATYSTDLRCAVCSKKLTIHVVEEGGCSLFCDVCWLL